MMEARHKSTYVWLALSRDHIVLPATDTFIHKCNEPYLTFGLTAEAGSNFLVYDIVEIPHISLVTPFLVGG